MARQDGLAAITLRGVASRVGMQAPSLYFHFDSKNAIFDAMFAHAWSEYLVVAQATRDSILEEMSQGDLTGGDVLRRMAHTFLNFSVRDPARYQLMNQRTIPGFEPSPEAYAPSVAVLEITRTVLAGLGATSGEDLDLLVALIGGLADSQLANDPDGHRWIRLADRAMDMLAHDLGLEPGSRRLE